jgi:general secretion pathway protein I
MTARLAAMHSKWRARSSGARRWHGKNGFTLIEVMVALAIVALALGAGLRAASALTNNAQRLADVMAAQWCAENQLVELRAQSALPGTGETEFTCQQLGRVYKGKLLVRPTATGPDLRQVHAVMSDENDVPLVTVVALLVRL